MTEPDKDGLLDSITDNRREFLKKGVLASGGLALGVGATGSVLSQTDGDQSGANGQQESGGGEALMFSNEFFSGGQIRIISPTIDQTPNLTGVPEGTWQNYNVRVGEYLVSGQEVLVFPSQDAQVQEDDIYSVGQEFTPFEEGAQEGLVTVTLEPVAQDDLYVLVEDGMQTATPTEDATPTPENETATPQNETTPEATTPTDGDDDVLLEPDDDFEIIDGGGKALVRANNFRPGALFQVTSNVIEWVPREDVQGSDIFSEYNTRMAQFLGTNEEFQLYPAEAAQVETGAIYVMRDEFDITDPEGNLLTIDFNRANENDIDTDLYDEDLL